MDLRRVGAGLRGAARRCSTAMRVDGAPHIGVLLDNVPDFSMWLGAAAVSGATIVGINPTRRGEGLERDITHTECQVIVTERRHLELLDGLDLGAADGRVLVIDDPSYDEASRRSRAPRSPRRSPVDDSTGSC